MLPEVAWMGPKAVIVLEVGCTVVLKFLYGLFCFAFLQKCKKHFQQRNRVCDGLCYYKVVH